MRHRRYMVAVAIAGLAVGLTAGFKSSVGRAADFECVQYNSTYDVDATGHWALDRSCTPTYPYIYGGGCEYDSGNSRNANLVAGYPSAVAERYRCEWYVGFLSTANTMITTAVCCK